MIPRRSSSVVARRGRRKVLAFASSTQFFLSPPPRAPLNTLQSISLTLQTCRGKRALPPRAERGPTSTRRRCRSTAKRRSSAQFCLRPRLSAGPPPSPVSSPPSMLADAGRARAASRAPRARGSHVRARSCRRRYGWGTRALGKQQERERAGAEGGEVDFSKSRKLRSELKVFWPHEKKKKSKIFFVWLPFSSSFLPFFPFSPSTFFSFRQKGPTSAPATERSPTLPLLLFLIRIHCCIFDKKKTQRGKMKVSLLSLSRAPNKKKKKKQSQQLCCCPLS